MIETFGAYGQFKVSAAGRSWILERPADLESLWQAMDEDDPEAEEHIPYWVEIWPATLALCNWLARQDLAGKKCLDLGCGLGLSALVASGLGAQVVGMDYELDALYFANRNARINVVPAPLWVRMDWNRPGFASASFERIWGGDIFYEQRFFDPLESLLLRCLAPGGRIWFGDPERAVSSTVWSRFSRRGWRVRNQGQEMVSLDRACMTVNLWELSRPFVM
jgi:predicted nicotinamide N-methyase